MNKKIIGLLIMTTILAFLVIGCGGSDDDKNNTDTTVETTTETAITTEAEDDEGIEFGDAPESYYYEYIFVMDGSEQVGFKIWAQDKKIKFEGGMEGETYFLDYEKGEGYLYIPADKMMVLMPLEGIESGWESPFMMAAEMDEVIVDGLTRVGNETIDGKACTIYEFDYDQGKYTYSVWDEAGIIVKMKVEMDGQSTYEYYFKDLIINENFEMEFEIPEDVQIIGG